VERNGKSQNLLMEERKKKEKMKTLQCCGKLDGFSEKNMFLLQVIMIDIFNAYCLIFW
jgi:hypothetical protein